MNQPTIIFTICSTEVENCNVLSDLLNFSDFFDFFDFFDFVTFSNLFDYFWLFGLQASKNDEIWLISHTDARQYGQNYAIVIEDC